MELETFNVGCSTKQIVSIHPNWSVIEIGGGANPCQRSNVITNYQQEENQRDAPIKPVPGARMLECDVQDMRKEFSDKEFDYSLCVQVLEHVDDPKKDCDEIIRISNRGYIETPNILCEQLIGWEFHKWFVKVDEKNPNKLVFMKKDSVDFERFGNFFHNMFYKSNPNQRKFKQMYLKYYKKFLICFYWQDSFECEVIL